METAGFLASYLPYLLARAAQAASEEFARQLRARGLDEPTWRALATLAGGRTENVTALGAACLLQQPTASKLLNRMTQQGWTVRIGVERDRRVVRIALSKAGEALAAELIAVAQRQQAELASAIPEANSERFRDTLRRIDRLRRPRARRHL